MDRFDDRGVRERRLWVDTSTGVILQIKEYGSQSPQIQMADYWIRAIPYATNIPPEVFDPRQTDLYFSEEHEGTQQQPNLRRSDPGLPPSGQ